MASITIPNTYENLFFAARTVSFDQTTFLEHGDWIHNLVQPDP